nr:MAG TPA: hypothetical protein [Caudoviricetes sp.]
MIYIRCALLLSCMMHTDNIDCVPYSCFCVDSNNNPPCLSLSTA